MFFDVSQDVNIAIANARAEGLKVIEKLVRTRTVASLADRLPEIEQVYREELRKRLRDKESETSDLRGKIYNLIEEVRQLKRDAESPVIIELKAEVEKYKSNETERNDYILNLENRLDISQSEVYELEQKIDSDPFTRLCKHFGITYFPGSLIGYELVIQELESRMNLGRSL